MDIGVLANRKPLEAPTIRAQDCGSISCATTTDRSLSAALGTTTKMLEGIEQLYQRLDYGTIIRSFCFSAPTCTDIIEGYSLNILCEVLDSNVGGGIIPAKAKNPSLRDFEELLTRRCRAQLSYLT